MMRKVIVKSACVALAAHSGVAQAGFQLNIPAPATRIATENYDLHFVMMVIILVVFAGVFAVMLYSIYAHRKSVGHKAEHFHENATVEIIWTVIPLVVLIAMAWPATRTILNLRDASSPDITIKAAGPARSSGPATSSQRGNRAGTQGVTHRQARAAAPGVIK